MNAEFDDLPEGGDPGIGDELRENLHAQNAAIPVAEGNADHAAAESGRRQRRGVVTRVAVAAVLLLGVGAYFAVDRDATPTEAASEDDADEAAAVNALGITTDGPSLELTDISSDTSPRPDVWNGGQIDGVYYFTSSAPYQERAIEVDSEDDWVDLYNQGTVYTYDGTWSSADTGDRFISTIRADGGVLYTVSTGVRGANDGEQAMALGVSNDAAKTWTWTEIDLAQAFGSDKSEWPSYYSATVEGKDGTYVVAADLGGVDWEQAIEMAQGAGVNIDFNNDEILEVDATGISYVRDAYAPDPTTCAGKRQIFEGDAYGYEAIEELWMAIEEEGREPTEAEYEQMEALEAESEAGRQKVQLELADHLRENGCEEAAVCLEDQAAMAEKRSALEVELRAELGLPDDSEIESEEEWRQHEALFEEFYERLDQELGSDESFYERCESMLYGEGPDWSEADVETSTWAELGVTVPDLWLKDHHLWSVTDGVVTNVGELYEGGDSNGYGYLQLNVIDDEFRVEVDLTDYDRFERSANEGDASEPEYAYAAYRSTDGVDWESTEASGQEFYYRNDQATLNNMAFAIDWGDEEVIEGDDYLCAAAEEAVAIDGDGSVATTTTVMTSEDAVIDDCYTGERPESALRRSVDGGAWETFTLAELAPGIDTTGYYLEGVEAGGYGVVAWATKWDDEAMYEDDRRDDAGPPDAASIVLYSADGLSWGVTELDGLAMNGVLVGENDVLVAPYPAGMFGPYEEREGRPLVTPIYLGSVG